MLSLFCLRLASGLSGAMLLLPPALVNPRFYRTQFLTVLGLMLGAAVFSYGTGDPGLRVAAGSTIVLAFFGSLAWSLEGAPAGRSLAFLTTLSALATLYLASYGRAADLNVGWRIAGELTSATLLGIATTAMLMGHSYLIAPSMSLTPLLRLLTALFIALVLRGVIAGIGLWLWAGEHSLGAEEDVLLFLPLRWGLGVVGPFILGIMAWQTARIRSTQSATGILYVVVILTFIGELVSQVLLQNDLLPS